MTDPKRPERPDDEDAGDRFRRDDPRHGPVPPSPEDDSPEDEDDTPSFGTDPRQEPGLNPPGNPRK